MAKIPIPRGINDIIKDESIINRSIQYQPITATSPISIDGVISNVIIKRTMIEEKTIIIISSSHYPEEIISNSCETAVNESYPITAGSGSKDTISRNISLVRRII